MQSVYAPPLLDEGEVCMYKTGVMKIVPLHLPTVVLCLCCGLLNGQPAV